MKNIKITFLTKLLLTTILISGNTLFSTTSAEGLNGPHQHGELEVTVLKISGQVVFDMVVPAQDIVGYEYAPKSEDDVKALEKAERSLYEVDNLNVLFDFKPKESCLPFESYVNSDLLNIHSHPKEKDQSFISKLALKEHPKKTEDDVHVVGVGGHTDFVMSYVFDCEGVETVTLGFAKQFPSIKKINIREKNLKGNIVKTFKTSSEAVIDFSEL